MKRGVRILIIAGVVAVTLVLGLLVYRHYERYPATDDAYIEADVVGIVARVTGPIVNLPIEDNLAVNAGQLLFEIDPQPYRIAVDKARAELDKTGQNVSALAAAVASAQAQLAEAKANLRLATAQYNRIQPLIKIGAVPYQDKDKADAYLANTRSGVDDAEARLAKAKHELGAVGADNPERRASIAVLENAELQLSWTQVLSPANGYVTNLDVSLGSYANIGAPLVSIVDTDSWRVEAYFKETQLRRIRTGDRARVYVPAYPGVRFEGVVQGIGWGVEQQGGDGSTGRGGVPSIDPTVDWVRMAQRFPVRVTLPNTDPLHPLRKGMRATVRIDPSDAR